jgi:hypothetical protein
MLKFYEIYFQNTETGRHMLTPLPLIKQGLIWIVLQI